MIEFICNFEGKNKIRNIDKYPELLKVEVDFKIIINGKVFFDDHYFPIFEFLYYINKWKICCDDSFEYNSLETDENPLISFIRESDELWIIRSSWQFFECDLKFEKNEIIEALNSLKKIIN